MNARLTMLLTIAVLATAALASCGDDESISGGGPGTTTAGGESADATQNGTSGGESSVEASALSKDEYLERASAACNKERETFLLEVGEFMKRNRSKAKSEAALFTPMIKQVYLPKIEAEITAVRALGAPEGDEAEIEAILVAQQSAVDEVRGAKQLQNFDEIYPYFAEANQMYRDYGFKACTNGE